MIRKPSFAFRALLPLTLFAALAATGCSRFGDQKPAVEKAIKAHLSSRTDLAINQMVMEVKDVKVDGDKAGADVLFRVTNAPEMQMGYHYELAREGGEWKVLQGRPAQTNSAHPTGSADPGTTDPNALPPGHPPVSGGQMPGNMSGEMPAGHPAVEGAPGGGAMPPGHPPMGGGN
jgi:hypothetical protein